MIAKDDDDRVCRSPHICSQDVWADAHAVAYPAPMSLTDADLAKLRQDFARAESGKFVREILLLAADLDEMRHAIMAESKRENRIMLYGLSAILAVAAIFFFAAKAWPQSMLDADQARQMAAQWRAGW